MPAVRYDKSRTSTRLYDWASGQKLTVTAASVRSTPIDSVEVMARPSVRGFLKVGDGTVEAANTAGSISLEAGESFHLQIAQGQCVAFIRDTADGVLFLLPVA